MLLTVLVLGLDDRAFIVFIRILKYSSYLVSTTFSFVHNLLMTEHYYEIIM